MQFGSVLEPARALQPGYHGSLRIVACGEMLHEPPGQHFRIKLLENVFVFDVLEYHHNLLGEVFKPLHMNSEHQLQTFILEKILHKKNKEKENKISIVHETEGTFSKKNPNVFYFLHY